MNFNQMLIIMHFSQVKLKAKSPAKQDDTMSFEAGLLAQYGVKEQNSTNMTESETMSQVQKISFCNFLSQMQKLGLLF